MKHIIPALMALMIMVSCTNDKKILVLYYSQTGATEAVAQQFSARLGADIVSFDVEEAYTGSFDETVARCLEERASGFIPTLKPLDVKVEDYDIVFLGYPVWFGTCAPPVAALLQKESFEGKTVVPFCTFGSGGLDTSTADLREAIPLADIADGYGVRNARIAKAPAEVERFLIAKGFIEGANKPLPEFSAPQPVTDAQAAVFDEACGGYQFPLGTPVSFCVRETPWGTEYAFTAQNTTPDGQLSESTVFVTVTDGMAEFTEVVR